MSTTDVIVEILGYVVIAPMLCAVIAVIFQIVRDRIKARKGRDLWTNRERLARMDTRLAEFRTELSCYGDEVRELEARVSAIESIVDQFRPAEEFKHSKPQQEGDPA